MNKTPKDKLIKVYPKHDDYGTHAKVAEKLFNWIYEQNRSVIEEIADIEMTERILYGTGTMGGRKV